MAIIKCPECESNISNMATSCPQCGFPLSDDQMRTRIGIPAIPKEILEGLRKGQLGGSFLDWKVREGEWVKEGEVIAIYNVKSFPFPIWPFAEGRKMIKATINAPISGKIAKINRIEYANWDWTNYKSSSYRWDKGGAKNPHLDKESIIVFIDTPHEMMYAPSTDRVYKSIAEYGYLAGAKIDGGYFRKSRFELADFPRDYLEGMSRSDLRIDKLPIE